MKLNTSNNSNLILKQLSTRKDSKLHKGTLSDSCTRSVNHRDIEGKSKAKNGQLLQYNCSENLQNGCLLFPSYRKEKIKFSDDSNSVNIPIKLNSVREVKPLNQKKKSKYPKCCIIDSGISSKDSERNLNYDPYCYVPNNSSKGKTPCKYNLHTRSLRINRCDNKESTPCRKNPFKNLKKRGCSLKNNCDNKNNQKIKSIDLSEISLKDFKCINNYKSSSVLERNEYINRMGKFNFLDNGDHDYSLGKGVGGVFRWMMSSYDEISENKSNCDFLSKVEVINDKKGQLSNCDDLTSRVKTTLYSKIHKSVDLLKQNVKKELVKGIDNLVISCEEQVKESSYKLGELRCANDSLQEENKKIYCKIGEFKQFLLTNSPSRFVSSQINRLILKIALRAWYIISLKKTNDARRFDLVKKIKFRHNLRELLLKWYTCTLRDSALQSLKDLKKKANDRVNKLINLYRKKTEENNLKHIELNDRLINEYHIKENLKKEFKLALVKGISTLRPDVLKSLAELNFTTSNQNNIPMELRGCNSNAEQFYLESISAPKYYNNHTRNYEDKINNEYINGPLLINQSSGSVHNVKLDREKVFHKDIPTKCIDTPFEKESYSTFGDRLNDLNRPFDSMHNQITNNSFGETSDTTLQVDCPTDYKRYEKEKNSQHKGTVHSRDTMGDKNEQNNILRNNEYPINLSLSQNSNDQALHNYCDLDCTKVPNITIRPVCNNTIKKGELSHLNIRDNINKEYRSLSKILPLEEDCYQPAKQIDKLLQAIATQKSFNSPARSISKLSFKTNISELHSPIKRCLNVLKSNYIKDVQYGFPTRQFKYSSNYSSFVVPKNTLLRNQHNSR